jgi:hypothetical protein
VTQTPSDRGPARCIHLDGGCRALDAQNDKLQLDPAASNGKTAVISLPSYHAAYAVLQKAGLKVVGVDLYCAPEQTDGRRLPDWRGYYPVGTSLWPCAEQADHWSFIAHAAFQQEQGPLWDVASRVSHQLRTCDWRLRQVSECYHQQLSATVRQEGFEAGRRFMDGFTWLGYLALQSFLVDACVLRDYLAASRSLLLPQPSDDAARPKIRGMASLKKYYLNKVSSDVPIDKVLAETTAPGGWLHRLSSYRVLVVHCAPLASAGKTLYAVCIALPLDASTTLPAVKFPLPSDPEGIQAGRSSGAYLNDPEMNYARFRNALDDPDEALDGLHYAHATLGQLAVLAAELSALMPVNPVMPHLMEKDLLDIKIVPPRPNKDAR